MTAPQDPSQGTGRDGPVRRPRPVPAPGGPPGAGWTTGRIVSAAAGHALASETIKVPGVLGRYLAGVSFTAVTCHDGQRAGISHPGSRADGQAPGREY